MEGIGREAYPEFQPLEAIRPFLTEVYLRRLLDPKRHSQAVVRSVMDGLALLKEAPLDLRRVLRKLRRGELTVLVRDPDVGALEAGRGIRQARWLLGLLTPVFLAGGAVLVGRDSRLQILAGLVSLAMSGACFVGLGFSLLRDDGR
jgi:predicted unusual protein kinase regulating ubiquinone biosynthesis (AarF/ABC1/UbiB family)